jgi:hypothetical protein
MTCHVFVVRETDPVVAGARPDPEGWVALWAVVADTP